MVNSDQRYFGPMQIPVLGVRQLVVRVSAVPSIGRAIEHLLEGEAARCAIVIGPMRGVQEVAQHEIFKNLLRIGLVILPNSTSWRAPSAVRVLPLIWTSERYPYALFSNLYSRLRVSTCSSILRLGSRVQRSSWSHLPARLRSFRPKTVQMRRNLWELREVQHFEASPSLRPATLTFNRTGNQWPQRFTVHERGECESR